MGFTRDLSTSGMCLEVDRGHPIGSLLRITVRSIDGRPTLDTLARVAWCGEGPDGRFRLGLALLDAGRPTLARVRPMGAMQLARGA